MNFISIASKQFESANAIYLESEKIKLTLKNLRNDTNDTKNISASFNTLQEVNKNVEKVLSKIITEKLKV